MKIISKEVGQESKIIDADKNFIRMLYRRGYQKLKFSSRYVLYVSYKEVNDDDNFNCALSTPKSPIPLNCFGTFYVKKKILFFRLDVKDRDLLYINKFINKSIKNIR